MQQTVCRVEIPCITITELLARHNVTHVDMLSIDIEAAEYNALSPLLRPDARDVMTTEVFWSDAQLRWLLSDLGFWKLTDIAHVDDIFVRVNFMDHATVDARPHYYKMMQDSQRQRGRPIIAPWRSDSKSVFDLLHAFADVQTDAVGVFFLLWNCRTRKPCK